MKYSHQSPVSQYTRYSTYTPANYTPPQYTSTHTPTQYTSTKYSSTKYMPAYTPTHYTPSLYTPTYKSTSSYTPICSEPTHCTSATGLHAPKEQAAPTPTVVRKPAKRVHFPNDIVFQDIVRHGEMDQIGRFMRARKVRVDTVFLSGMAALHEAVLFGNLECVKLLVKYGADVHQRDEDGWTPLHMACSDGFPEIAKYLMSLGANSEVENENGEKPADLIDPDCKELARLFEVGCVQAPAL